MWYLTFLLTKMKWSIKMSYIENIKKLRKLLNEADFILLGAGAGLSTAAGLNYGGERFERNFPDFIKKYTLTDMYSSGFYPFKSENEKWAYWSRHIKVNRFSSDGVKMYEDLLSLVEKKEYFILTTNADGLFKRTGFDENRIFMPQGDYAKIQCAVPCCQKLYDDEKMIKEMVKEQNECKIPTSLIPKCPVCGGKMEVNVRKDNTFVEDEVWHKENENYQNFLKKCVGKKTLFLEMGVGYNTPTIIKFAFENLVANNKNANLVRFNKDYPEISQTNKDKTLVFSKDINKIIQNLINQGD